MSKFCSLWPSLQEFDLLHYSLSSACIFFRADLNAEEESEEQEEGSGSGEGVATSEIRKGPAFPPSYVAPHHLVEVVG